MPLLRLTGRVRRTGDMAVAYCEQLPLGGVGETPTAAFRSLLECVESFVELVGADGGLDDFRAMHGDAITDDADGSERFQMTVPYWY